MSNQMPSRRRMVRNLGRTIRDIATDPRLISEDEKKSRLDICHKCDYFVGGRCSKCGCYLRTKTKFRSSKCPIGKW